MTDHEQALSPEALDLPTSAPRSLAAASTTLGRSTGQLVRKPSARRPWALLGLMAALAALITLLVLQVGGRASQPIDETTATPSPVRAASSKVTVEQITPPAPSVSEPSAPAAAVATELPAKKQVNARLGTLGAEKGQVGSAEPAVAQVAPPDSSAGAEKPVAAIDAGTPQRPTTGALSISSKPPCEILVDGKPLGLRTPQLDVQLAPGVHKITLVNVEFGIEDSFSIEIAAGERVRTSKDFSDKLKRVEVPSKTTTINPFGK